MPISNKSYPYPVLGNGNDVSGEFKILNFEYELKGPKIALDYHYLLHNDTLETMITGKQAVFVMELECPHTFYRDSFHSHVLKNHWEIESKNLRGKVSVNFYIVSNHDIENYCIAGAHPDYGNTGFPIKKGDVLALGGYTYFIADKEFDPLNPPIRSIMSIIEGSQKSGPMTVDYECDTITIALSKNDYQNYVSLLSTNDALGTIHAGIVFPVLVEAVYLVVQHGKDYEGFEWCEKIQEILDRRKLPVTEPLIAAQKILDAPIDRSLVGIRSILNLNGEEE